MSGKVHPSISLRSRQLPMVTCALEYIDPPWGWPSGNCTTDGCRRAFEARTKSNTKDLLRRCAISDRVKSHVKNEQGANQRFLERFEKELESYEMLEHARFRLYQGLPAVTQGYHRLLLSLAFAWYSITMEIDEICRVGVRSYIGSGWNYIELVVSASSQRVGRARKFRDERQSATYSLNFSDAKCIVVVAHVAVSLCCAGRYRCYRCIFPQHTGYGIHPGVRLHQLLHSRL